MFFVLEEVKKKKKKSDFSHGIARVFCFLHIYHEFNKISLKNDSRQ